MISGLALFPELFSSSTTKYERFALWLASNHNVVSSSLRDLFTAGGQETLKIKNKKFEKVPRILVKLNEYSNDIINILTNSSKNDLCETWRVKKIDKDRISQWIDLIVTQSDNYDDISNLLNSIFK